ncbi:MAG: magnesium transporter [Chromatiales bacterium]|nr:magnesium transporter [Chromatiales bacterium]
MNREEILFSLRKALAYGDPGILPAILRQIHPADLVTLLETFDAPDKRTLITQLPAATRAQLFGYFPPDRQIELIALFDRRELLDLFLHMDADERADLYNTLEEGRREQIMPALAQVEREDIRKLASYPEESTGAVMTSDYATLTPELTAPAAIALLRQIAPDTETIYQAYVVDERRRLVGTVSLRELIVAPAHARVGDLMKRDPVFIHAEQPKDEAARLIAVYDLIALPVINGEDRLVGIVTYDDAMDVAEQAATEDFHKGGGSLALTNVGLRDASAWLLYRKRVFWLLVLVFGNLFSGAGIAYFEDTIAAYVALVFFLPLLIDSGGNAGAQASTLMVRSLATGDVRMRDWGGMLGREFFVAGLLGLTMAMAVSTIGLFRGGPEIAMVVSLSMVVIVIVGSVIGMSLPFLLSRLRLDPATASAPLITSIADATGVIIYLSIAVAILGAPAL